MEGLPTGVLFMVTCYLAPTSLVFLSRCSKTLYARLEKKITQDLRIKTLRNTPYKQWVNTFIFDDPMLLAQYIRSDTQMTYNAHVLKRNLLFLIECATHTKKPPYDCIQFLAKSELWSSVPKKKRKIH